MDLHITCQCGEPLKVIATEINRLQTITLTILRCNACMDADTQMGDADRVAEEARETLTPDETTALLTRCADVITGLIDWSQHMGQFEAPIWRNLVHLRCSLAQNRRDPRAMCGHPFTATDDICTICEECPACCVHDTDHEEETPV